MKALSIALILLFIVCSTHAQTDVKFASFLQVEREKLPIAGELIFDGSQLSSYSFGGSKKITSVDSLPFGKSFQLTVTGPGANPWEPQFMTTGNISAIASGDYIFYIFYIRVLECSGANGFGQAAFYSQQATSPWAGLGSRSLTVRENWQQVYLLAQAPSDFAVNEMNATMHLGFVKQVVEVSPIIALNLGQDFDPQDLPTTPIYYEGMEADAPWRTQAAARIEQYRKSNLNITVKNKNGHPVKNARVHVAMQNHAFGFGTFMSTLALRNGYDADMYRDEVALLFNCATTPFYMGDGSWGWYGPGDSQITYPALAEWLMQQGIPTKGHMLIWPSWQWMPPFFQDYENDPAAMQNAIFEHLQTIVPIGVENKLMEWDVVNEPHINHDVMDICGDEVMIDWYKYVHDMHPSARLVLNEYNILMSGGKEDFQDDFAYYIQLLLDGGAPLGGIGMQSHFGEDLTDIPQVLRILDRFAAFKLPIQITEFDIDILDEEIQAAYTRDFFTAVFSYPATDKIVMWGFWQGDQWKPNGAMIRTDWSYKPNYHVYTDLVFKQWWTDEEGSSNRNGYFTTRAFLGDYQITVEFNGKSVAKTMNLAKDGAELEFQLDTEATGVEQKESGVPAEYGLLRNFPNPFNSETIIQFTPRYSGYADFVIYNSIGEQVLRRQIQVEKDHTMQQHLNASAFSSGVYVCRIDLPREGLLTGKLLLVK